MNKTLLVATLFAAALVAGYILRTISIPAPAEASQEPKQGSKETFMQRQVGMPLDMQAAPGVSGFSASTSPLLGSEPKPVSEKPYEMANDQELFMFEGNRVSADCCPSPFTSDKGCICLTDKQINEFATRGGNRA